LAGQEGSSTNLNMAYGYDILEKRDGSFSI